jgi:hypothetical protein
LVEVVARGVGGLYAPVGTILQAKADAKAQLIRAGADIETRQLLERAAARLGHVEVQRQRNIESVIALAQKALPSEVNSDPVEQDWINHFFSSVQDVSSADLQTLWGKILAGETATPGIYSRRLLGFLKTFDKQEAEVLTAVLSVCFRANNGWGFYFSQSPSTRAAVKSKVGTVDWESHLIDVGVLSSQEHTPPVSQVAELEISLSGIHFVMDGPGG